LVCNIPIVAKYREVDKKLIINAAPSEVQIALLEDHKLVEFHKQKKTDQFIVGDVFLGHIKKLMPGLNAAFVDIGSRKDAFLHYTDLGPQVKSVLKYVREVTGGSFNGELLDGFNQEPDNPKNGRIEHVFKRNQPLLIQILKEPISTKGPRLSAEITIPGRYMVLTPFSNAVAVSKKLQSQEERERLKKLAESIKPKNFGLILRTAAEGKKVAELYEELKYLMDKWKAMNRAIKENKSAGKVLSELDKSSSLIRDVMNDSFNKISVNDRELYNGIKGYVTAHHPEQKKIVDFHKSPKPIFEAYGVSRQIKTSFGETSTLPSGAYLVIEHTEAMHVIDVNSGPKKKQTDQESAAKQVNREAAKEIARQLRLRDIGGLIIIDFIDMRKRENKESLLRAMKEYMQGDRAQHTILPLSKFGLMQITRQRTKPEVKINTDEKCPSCDGSGKMRSAILIIENIERGIRNIAQSRPKTKLKLSVHPFIRAYIKAGFPSLRMKWYRTYSKWINVTEDSDKAITQFQFFDGNNDEILTH